MGNLELCGQDANNMFIWAPKQNTIDLYDGVLNPGNSAMQVRFNGAANNGYVTKSLYNQISAPVTVKYEIDSEDFADIFGKNNKNNIREERGTITMADTIIPTILNANFVGRYECGYTLNMDGLKEPREAGYTDCYDDWAWTGLKNHVKVTIDGEKIGKKAFYGKAFTPFQPIVDMFGQGLRKYGQKGEHTVVWNVADKFGNNAATVTKKIQITDTIPPTLYNTKKDARATKNLQGDDCHRTHSAKWSAGNKGDYTNAECEFEHDDKHDTFTHKSLMTDKNSHVVGESVHRDDPMATEMVSSTLPATPKITSSSKNSCRKALATLAWTNAPRPPPPWPGRSPAPATAPAPNSTCSSPAPTSSSTLAPTASTRPPPAVPSSTLTGPVPSSPASNAPTTTTAPGTLRLPATTTTLTLVPPAPTWSTATSPRMLKSAVTL